MSDEDKSKLLETVTEIQQKYADTNRGLYIGYSYVAYSVVCIGSSLSLSFYTFSSAVRL